MQISGLQKLTLLDYPGVMACIVFTKGCNFKCPYCHNAPLVLNTEETSIIEESELLSFLNKRKGILEGVVITGGEPLLNSDIGNLLSKIKELGYKIKLDTNGSNPSLLKRLVLDNLLDYVAMDIKNAPEYYFKAIGKEKNSLELLNLIEESKNFLLKSYIPYEFRTTVVKGIHKNEDILSLAKWINGAEKYYLQQFKDSGNLINPEGLSAFTEEEMKKFADLVKPYVESVFLRGF